MADSHHIGGNLKLGVGELGKEPAARRRKRNRVKAEFGERSSKRFATSVARRRQRKRQRRAVAHCRRVEQARERVGVRVIGAACTHNQLDVECAHVGRPHADARRERRSHARRKWPRAEPERAAAVVDCVEHQLQQESIFR